MPRDYVPISPVTFLLAPLGSTKVKVMIASFTDGVSADTAELKRAREIQVFRVTIFWAADRSIVSDGKRINGVTKRDQWSDE